MAPAPNDDWVNRNGLSFHYRDWGGAGQPIVLLHGLASTCHIWDMVAPILAEDNAVIALGCVIRGATSHYDYVCGEAAKGIGQVTLQTGVPVMFGVLTTENIEQAIERAGTKAGNKGFEVAVGAIEMANLMESL